MKEKTNWLAFWEEGRTPWDLRGPHAATRYLAAQLGQICGYDYEDKIVLIPGAGRAHDATIFLQKKSNVFAIDISPIACKEAEETHKPFNNFTALCYDFLSCESKITADIVFDRAMLCALPADLRSVYAESIKNALNDDGFLISIPFFGVKDDIAGPPFAVDEQEMFELFGREFNIVLAERSRFESGLGGVTSENLYIFSKN